MGFSSDLSRQRPALIPCSSRNGGGFLGARLGLSAHSGVTWAARTAKVHGTCSKWTEVFFCGLGSGSFSFLFGGTPLDGVIEFIAGALLNMVLKKFSQRKTSKFITNIFGSALVTLVSLITFSIGLPVLYDKIIIGAIMPLVPGIALTTSIRDFFNGDYLSGAIHMIDAVLTAFCIAAGVGTVMTIYNLVVGGIL